MALIRRKGRLKASIKISGLFITGLSFLFILSCYSWDQQHDQLRRLIGHGDGLDDCDSDRQKLRLPLGNTTSILAIVKDRTGAPAPKGTQICTTVVRNGLLKPGNTVVAIIVQPVAETGRQRQLTSANHTNTRLTINRNINDTTGQVAITSWNFSLSRGFWFGTIK